jgi:hypothetical protein
VRVRTSKQAATTCLTQSHNLSYMPLLDAAFSL